MATQHGNDDRESTPEHAVSVYDVFLALLPLPMIASVFAGRLTPFPVNAALFVGATTTAALAGWGLFWHYPS